jgi:hypothetical protein
MLRHLIDLAERDTAVAAEKINRCVAGDARHPVGGLFQFFQLVAALESLNKRLLGQVLGVIDVTDQPVNQQEDTPHVLSDKPLLSIGLRIVLTFRRSWIPGRHRCHNGASIESYWQSSRFLIVMTIYTLEACRPREPCAAAKPCLSYLSTLSRDSTSHPPARTAQCKLCYLSVHNRSSYLESKTPVAITRHGSTIGVYVPTKPMPSKADLEALRVAGEKMQELIAAAGTSEEELMEDFKKLRREKRMQKD